MIRRICLALGLALLCATSTAKPPEVPMPLAAQLPVELVASQQEMGVEVPDTATQVGAQFGLIGALVGSAVQNNQVQKAEAAVIPLRNLLVDYPFNARIESALRAKLASEGLSPAPVVTVSATGWEPNNAQQDKSTMPRQALVLRPSYQIDHTFNDLSVNLSAQFVERTPKNNQRFKNKVVFNQVYRFHFPLVPDPASTDAIKRWEAVGAERIGQMLDVGVSNVVDMLVYDLSAEGRAQWDRKNPSSDATIKGMTFSGMLLRQTDDYAWCRMGLRMQRSLHGYHPVDASTMIAAAPALVAAPPAMATAADASAAVETSVALPAAVPTSAPVEAAAPAAVPTVDIPVDGR